MGLGKIFKKAVKFAKDTHSLEAISGAISGAAMGASVGGWPGAVAGAVAGGLGGTAQHKATERQEKAQAQELAMQRRIANQAASAAAMPVGVEVSAPEVVAATEEMNYETSRKRALTTADTRTSARLQRWASNGKRKIL